VNEEKLYTPEEIAERLKLSKYTIYEMIKREELPAYHIGRSIRVSESQVQAFIAAGATKQNTFPVEIIKQDESKHALTEGNVKICVKTDLEGKARLRIPPEDVILSREPFQSSARNVHKGKVTEIAYEDGMATVTVDIGVPLKAQITKKSMDELGISFGEECYATFKTMSVQVFK
jgi:molybdopterin-binding protein